MTVELVLALVAAYILGCLTGAAWARAGRVVDEA